MHNCRNAIAGNSGVD
jgi:serine/threonine protein kinase